ncbi:MAG TPA: hypothetical protein VKG92_12185 [Flavobacteriales bacterium]|nr:hypothetical protein [Flavobacteriales bacterium]
MFARAVSYLVVLLGMGVPLRGGSLESLPPIATYTFGLSLNTGSSSQLFTLFQVKEFEGKTIGVEPMTRQQFVLQAQGAVPSKANPEGFNLFKRYEVKACLLPDDSVHFLGDCDVLDQLWKLRFWEYPFLLSEGQHPGKGWSENRAAPSPRQLLLLTEYGMLHLSDMARGENVFHLLHDVCDSSWVDNYRKGY